MLLHPLSLPLPFEAWLGGATVVSGTVAFAFLLNADRTMRKLEDERRIAAARERAGRERLELLARASLALEEAVASVAAAGIPGVLQTVADQARTLACADFAVVELEKDSPCGASWGVPGKDLVATSGNAPSHATALRVCVGTDGFFRVEGLEGAPDFAAFQSSLRLRSLLGMPISFRGRRVGFLLLGNHLLRERFDEDDENTIRMLAGRAGIALEAARLYQRAALEKTFLEGVIDEMPDGVTLLDARGRVLAHNRAARRLAGVRSEDTDSLGNAVLLDAQTLDGQLIPWSSLPMFAACESGERTLRKEIVLVRGEDRVSVLASALPLFDSRNARVGAVAVYQDISRIRELERMREEWSSLIAHDLRQPIGTITLTADFLRQRNAGSTGEDLKALDRLESASGRLSTMIDDLLDVTRLDARNLALSCRCVEIEDLLLDCADRVAALTGASIRVVVDRAAPRLFADPCRLDQILGNLLSNAVKYGRIGAPVTVEARSTEAGVDIDVSNYGDGIRPEEIGRLFSRFHRTESARRSSTPGIGLGLYISKGLVEAHGGEISVTSVPNGRTTFTISLPGSAHLAN